MELQAVHSSPTPGDSPGPGCSSTRTESLEQVGVYFEEIADKLESDTFHFEHTNETIEPEHLYMKIHVYNTARGTVHSVTCECVTRITQNW